ncbi:MAG: methionine synthase, partial [Jiangellaceae bacterium]
VSLGVDRLDDDALHQLAVAVDAGLAVWPGVVPSMPPRVPATDTELAERVMKLWRRLDQDPSKMAERTVITPACGLAGADVAWARRAYVLARNTARAFAEMSGAD